MRTKEFIEYHKTLTNNLDTIKICVNYCNDIELKIGYDLDDVVQSSGLIKRALEIATGIGLKHFYALEFYFKFAFSYSQCNIPLFHGTRRYALTASKDEREWFFGACDKVIAFAKQWRDSGKIDWDKVREYNKVNRYFIYASVVEQYGRPLYQYGDFYLTSSYTSAISFSCNSAGELGEYAYSQCKGFTDLGIQLDEETLNAAKVVEEEYPKYRNSEKVILIYCGVKFEDLSSERGYSYSSMMEQMGVEEFASYIKSFIYDKVKDTDDGRRHFNFRLLNSDRYLPLELSETKFRKAFALFTKITDVDSYIKKQRWDF